jgi:hypothetical protein
LHPVYIYVLVVFCIDIDCADCPDAFYTYGDDSIVRLGSPRAVTPSVTAPTNQIGKIVEDEDHGLTDY